MECAICCEKFFTPTTKEESKRLYNEIGVMKYLSLVITPHHDPTYKCSTGNCRCIICGECYTKIICNGKDIYDMDIDDMPSKYYSFKCPYCRNIDWKRYMDNVLDELQYKILGEEEATNLIAERRKTFITKNP